MTNVLFDLFQGGDQRWRCFSAKLGSERIIVSTFSWATRDEAQEALALLLVLKQGRDGPTLH